MTLMEFVLALTCIKTQEKQKFCWFPVIYTFLRQKEHNKNEHFLLFFSV